METWWGEARPGSRVMVGGPDKKELLIGDGLPDWVRLPPKLGGTKVRVTGHHVAVCPVDNTHKARHLHLEKEVYVAECPTCNQFFWYSKARG